MHVYNDCEVCGKETKPIFNFKKFSHVKIKSEIEAEAVFEKPEELCFSCYKEAVKKELKGR